VFFCDKRSQNERTADITVVPISNNATAATMGYNCWIRRSEESEAVQVCLQQLTVAFEMEYAVARRFIFIKLKPVRSSLFVSVKQFEHLVYLFI
jgi:hypothetical protein